MHFPFREWSYAEITAFLGSVYSKSFVIFNVTSANWYYWYYEVTMDKRCVISGEAIFTFGRKWLKWGIIQFWKLLRQSSDIVRPKSRIACEDRLLYKQKTTGYSFPYHWITKPAVVLSFVLQKHLTNLHAMVMRGPVFGSCSDKLRDHITGIQFICFFKDCF